MKPCPFCGFNEGWIKNLTEKFSDGPKFKVECAVCKSCGPISKTMAGAEKKWNGLLKDMDETERWNALEEKEKVTKPYATLFNVPGMGNAKPPQKPQKFYPDIDEDIGAPMTTLNNTPGMGNAQPASMAAMAGSQQGSPNAIGSGDKWGNSLGPYTQNGQVKKKKKRKKRVYKKKKKINESIEDVLKPKSEKEIQRIIKNDPELSEIYNVYKFLKTQGYNVTLESNFVNPKIKEIISPDRNYILSFLPEAEKNWTGIGLGDTFGWGILNDDEGYLIKEDIDAKEAINIFIDLLENGSEAESKYLNEQNINPYDKIGIMMAKRMKVPLYFEKGKDQSVKHVKQKEVEKMKPTSGKYTYKVASYKDFANLVKEGKEVKKILEVFKLEGVSYDVHPISDNEFDKVLVGSEGILGAKDTLIPWDIIKKLMKFYKP